jgi:hypothetical protein
LVTRFQHTNSAFLVEPMAFITASLSNSGLHSFGFARDGASSAVLSAQHPDDVVDVKPFIGRQDADLLKVAPANRLRLPVRHDPTDAPASKVTRLLWDATTAILTGKRSLQANHAGRSNPTYYQAICLSGDLP